MRDCMSIKYRLLLDKRSSHVRSKYYKWICRTCIVINLLLLLKTTTFGKIKMYFQHIQLSLTHICALIDMQPLHIGRLFWIILALLPPLRRILLDLKECDLLEKTEADWVLRTKDVETKEALDGNMKGKFICILFSLKEKC